MKKKEGSIWRPTEQQTEQQLDGTNKVEKRLRQYRYRVECGHLSRLLAVQSFNAFHVGNGSQ